MRVVCHRLDSRYPGSVESQFLLSCKGSRRNVASWIERHKLAIRAGPSQSTRELSRSRRLPFPFSLSSVFVCLSVAWSTITVRPSTTAGYFLPSKHTVKCPSTDCSETCSQRLSPNGRSTQTIDPSFMIISKSFSGFVVDFGGWQCAVHDFKKTPRFLEVVVQES